MEQKVIVKVRESATTESGYCVTWFMVAEGRAPFAVGVSSVWSSVIAWVQRSGFDGPMEIRMMKGGVA